MLPELVALEHLDPYNTKVVMELFPGFEEGGGDQGLDLR